MILWTRVLISGHQPKQACHLVSKPLAELDRPCEGKYMHLEVGIGNRGFVALPIYRLRVPHFLTLSHSWAVLYIDISEQTSSRVVCWTNRELLKSHDDI